MLPGWLKSIPSAEREEAPKVDLSRGRDDPVSLREVAEWDLERQRMLFRILVPVRLMVRFHVDPIRGLDANGNPVVFARRGVDEASYRFELYHEGGATEPVAELELADTQFNQIEVVWVTLQDPFAHRYDIDILPDGDSTMRGTAGRNVVAEEAAMMAGLAPGQIRRGLRAFGWLAERIETFMLCLNQHEYMAQPLFYHTAILFERYGFGYTQGRALMEEINSSFQPGGELYTKLDESTPFRRRVLADTIRGRSWAIHDGIMGDRWDRVRMVKRLGLDSRVETAPGVIW
jgi:acetoin utilization protein AcuC